jgi:agmatine deiminase
MAWAVHPEWLDWLDKVKSELSDVIRAVAKFETVWLLTPPHEAVDARGRFAGENVEIVEAPVDDIWMRDIAPTFALRNEEVVAIDWNFNCWGSPKERPARPGDQLAKLAERIFGVPRISVSFVADAGALIADGCGTLITTRSCLLNPNRNPIFGAWETSERAEICARTSREQIPRIFPGNAVHVPATFCDDL